MGAALLFLAVMGAASDGGTVAVAGTARRVQVTQPCMGGARVTEEMIKREETVLARQELTVLSGSTPEGMVAARVKTDAAGRFKLRLAPGAYCVLLGRRDPVKLEVPDAGAEQHPVAAVAAAGPHYDPACMAELANPTPKCDAQLTVHSGADPKFDVVLYSSNRCGQPWAHPCWRGPMPP